MGGQCIVGTNKKIPSASFGFNAMWFSRNPAPNGEINYVDHITGQHVHVHDVTYLEVWDDLPGNKPWPMQKATFGGPDVYSGLMVDVYVEDNGEPGKEDKFLVFLDGEYLGGSSDYFGSLLTGDPILAGNIQIHKPPKQAPAIKSHRPSTPLFFLWHRCVRTHFCLGLGIRF